jgi:hypothetical protein
MLMYADVCSELSGRGNIMSKVEELGMLGQQGGLLSSGAPTDRCDSSRMLTHAHACSRMLTYSHVCYVCSRILTYAHVCSRMLTYADTCAHMLTHPLAC